MNDGDFCRSVFHVHMDESNRNREYQIDGEYNRQQLEGNRIFSFVSRGFHIIFNFPPQKKTILFGNTIVENLIFVSFL